MHVITRKRLNEFAEKHPDTESALANWYRLMKRSDFSSFVELREVFPAADQVVTHGLQCEWEQGSRICGDPL